MAVAESETRARGRVFGMWDVGTRRDMRLGTLGRDIAKADRSETTRCYGHLF